MNNLNLPNGKLTFKELSEMAARQGAARQSSNQQKKPLPVGVQNTVKRKFSDLHTFKTECDEEKPKPTSKFLLMAAQQQERNGGQIEEEEEKDNQSEESIHYAHDHEEEMEPRKIKQRAVPAKKIADVESRERTPAKKTQQHPPIPKKKIPVVISDIKPEDIIVTHIEFPLSLASVQTSNRRYKTRVHFTWIDPVSKNEVPLKRYISFGSKTSEDFIDHKSETVYNRNIKNLQKNSTNPLSANFYRLNLLNNLEATNLIDAYATLVKKLEIA